MPGPEFEILLQSVRFDDPYAALRAAEVIDRKNIDWVKLLDSAEVHCIRPQLEGLLSSIPAEPVPGHIMEALGTAKRENLLRQMRDMAEFLSIKMILDESGITAIPFKGFWLAEKMYGNIAAREANDLDLFIDINDLEKVKAIMKGRGFVNTSFINRLKDDYVAKELCEYNFGKYDGDVCVHHFEFHWRSSQAFFRMNITLDDLRSQIATGRIEGNELQVFTPAANLLLAVMHHGGKEQYAVLKQLLDIARIIKNPEEIDWQWLLREAGRFNLVTVLMTGIRMAGILTGVRVPPAAEEAVRSRKVISLSEERLRKMSMPVSYRSGFRFEAGGWLFRIRSREGVMLKLHLSRHFVRKVLLPGLVPERYHHLFYNKKIRKEGLAADAI